MLHYILFILNIRKKKQSGVHKILRHISQSTVFSKQITKSQSSE